MSTQLDNLLNYSVPELIQWCADMGEKPFRAEQVMKWIHQRGVVDIDVMTDISKTLGRTVVSLFTEGHVRGPCWAVAPSLTEPT